ncbi:hypothetical protein GQ600_8956 [Phytophthora cactorum]|nr:hypothetical protein GQ600_8956 [Phytophthora cactorum]
MTSNYCSGVVMLLTEFTTVAEMQVLGAQDRIALSRERVAALAYNMTNRQEIAGPLAVLYLYRGSNCYSRALCASLPLGDAVRQLSMTEYGCALVNASDDVQKSKYRAVSNLDDYVFRPRNLETVCLYEFTMWYFNKKSISQFENEDAWMNTFETW